MVIDQYAFGKIVIDGQTYTRDVILTPGQVWDGWWRERGHSLSLTDLEKAFQAHPGVLIVGTGAMGRMRVPAETRQEVERRGIELHVLPTGKAWALYNELEPGGRKVVAALHLAC
jgi:hypothetical protein